MEITGNDFYEGFIPVGADLECEFEILDSGNIVIGLKIPSIGEIFNNKNFILFKMVSTPRNNV